tara:strand:+ start:1165 stop:1326 length:162 start_codon:yes stop_codon:yes gene_type:complete
LPKIKRTYSYQNFYENGGTTISKIIKVKIWCCIYWRVIGIYRTGYDGKIIKLK